MKAVARSDRSLLQDQQRADPKAAPPQGAQPSTAPPAPAIPPPVAAPVPVSTPTPARRTAASYRSAGRVARRSAAGADRASADRRARVQGAGAGRGADPRSVVAQFSSATPPGVAGGVVAGADRGGRGGGGAGAANRQIAMDAIAAPPLCRTGACSPQAPRIDRWRGATWSAVPIDPPAHITSGAAPTPPICWLVGRGGVVLISTNGQPFVRVTPPTAADLASIRAISARDATVTTTDGRSFRTTDGGVTWVTV